MRPERSRSIGRLYRQYVLPGVIFQSVLIGGAYATGREIVEYSARFGSMGVWSIVVIGLGFSLIAALAYEFARVFRTYDYRSLLRALIGPLWPLFDVIFVVMVVVIIAVVSAASGRVVEEVFGWNAWIGIVLLMALVGVLMAAGRRAIERFKTVGTALLYAGFLLFAGLVIAATRTQLAAAFDRPPLEALDAVSTGAVLWAGVLYVGYNLAVLPATFFVLDEQTGRGHTLVAGLVTGLLATVPFVLTYLAIMGFYPDPAVIEAPVPWLTMLRHVGAEWVIGLYAFVVFWTLVETATGLIHAIVHRVDAHRVERGRRGLRPWQEGFFALAVLVLAALLSRFGLIALVAQGYSALAYGFLLLFALPLLTIGVWRLTRTRRPASMQHSHPPSG